MIHSLQGTILECSHYTVILSCGPIAVSLQTAHAGTIIADPEVMVTFFTQLLWSQEHGPSLFGFATIHERTLFMLLIDCNGIGPKMALGLLAQLGIAGIINAVHRETARSFAQISGIGTKRAEQLLVYLKHKHDVLQKLNVGTDSDTAIQQETLQLVHEALTSLRYSRQEVQSVMQQVRTLECDMPFDQVMRKALALLSK